MPVRTRPVDRAVRPQSRIASRTSSGVRSSGPVTVSVSGMPSQSVRHTMRWPLSDTSRRDTSSTLTWVTVSRRPLNGSQPLTPMIAVRWNPVGIEPSRVLLPGDVHLVDDVHVHHQTELDRHVNRLLVHQERRRVVHLVRADVEVVQEVGVNLLLRLELHESRAVIIPQLGRASGRMCRSTSAAWCFGTSSPAGHRQKSLCAVRSCWCTSRPDMKPTAS